MDGRNWFRNVIFNFEAVNWNEVLQESIDWF